MALDAYASRLEECEADDVAVAQAGACAYCTALYRLTSGDRRTIGGLGAPGPGRQRSLLARLTAVYPTTEYRLARQGVELHDVVARVEQTVVEDPAAGSD
jgi:Zn-dependent protease with chaperone function